MDYSFAKIDKNDFTTKFLPYIPNSAHSTIKCNFLNCFLIEQVFRFFKH